MNEPYKSVKEVRDSADYNARHLAQCVLRIHIAQANLEIEKCQCVLNSLHKIAASHSEKEQTHSRMCTELTLHLRTFEKLNQVADMLDRIGIGEGDDD